MKLNNNVLYTLAPALFWLALVTLFSLTPEVPRVPAISDDMAAIGGHLFIYAGLAALIYRLHMRLLAGHDRRPPISAGLAVLAAASVGLTFEWAQVQFTEVRAFQTTDVAANTLGAATAAAALMAFEANGSQLKFVIPTVITAGAVLTAFSVTSYFVWDPSLPYIGDHWHASYRVVICGQEQPLFPEGPGNVHTHGDGYIHIHPQSSADEGKNANLGAFFRSVGGKLTDTSITMPSGKTYTNGDACPDGSSGSVRVSKVHFSPITRVEPIDDAADYVPRNRDRLLIEFGPARSGDAPGS